MAVTGKMIGNTFLWQAPPNRSKHTREERGEDQVQLLRSLERALPGVDPLQTEQDDT
jgi:hypothetical protein